MVIPPMDLGLGVLLASAGTIIATWKQITSFLYRLTNLFICRMVVKSDVAESVLSYVYEKSKRSPFSMRVFGSAKSYVKSQKRVESIGYETISGEPMLVFVKNRPIIVSRTGGSPDSAHNSSEENIGRWDSKGDIGPINISFIRGTFDVDKFLIEALDHYNHILHNNVSKGEKLTRFKVSRLKGKKSSGELEKGNQWSYYREDPQILIKMLQTKSARLLKYNLDDLNENINKSPFCFYPFPNSSMKILEEIKLWKESGDWYKERGIPWKRGYLLHGPGGTGKSTFIKSVAQTFDMPLFVFDLANETNESFVENFKEIQSNSPAVAVIEDIDAIFQGRKNITKGINPKDSLTFDCFLNTISGVNNSDGILLFITTNHIEQLDAAIGAADDDGKSSRPGRIDRILHFGTMGEIERHKLAEMIFSGLLDDKQTLENLINQLVIDGNNETAAQFQDRCVQKALKLFWEKNGKR